MRFAITIALVFFTKLVFSNINCIYVGGLCTKCNEGYRYNNVSCVPYCPTGSATNNITMACETSEYMTVFSTAFSDYTNYSAKSVGIFNSPNNISFNDTSRLSPIPTYDRGFYFENTSSLISKKN